MQDDIRRGRRSGVFLPLDPVSIVQRVDRSELAQQRRQRLHARMRRWRSGAGRVFRRSRNPQQPRRLAIKAGNDPMVAINDLVEEWIQIRSTLQRQLKMLQSGEASSESYISENEKTATITRIKACIEQMNALLKEYARVHQL